VFERASGSYSSSVEQTMKRLLYSALATAMLAVGTTAQQKEKAMEQTAKLYTFTMKTIDGTDKSLGDYKGKVLLIVNVASKCGFTPQYEGLESLYETYKDKGFMILGFPANDFLWQEPGSDTEIKQFCSLTYHVSFDMFSKISVKGGSIHPLYEYLTKESGAQGSVKWNFQKYLVDRKGNVVVKFPSSTEPLDPRVTQKLEELLSQPG
jgi:glutathione peroxidase